MNQRRSHSFTLTDEPTLAELFPHLASHPHAHFPLKSVKCYAPTSRLHGSLIFYPILSAEKSIVFDLTVPGYALIPYFEHPA